MGSCIGKNRDKLTEKIEFRNKELLGTNIIFNPCQGNTLKVFQLKTFHFKEEENHKLKKRRSYYNKVTISIGR